ncbi:MAG: P-II family nitrogen regulator [Proteobacteria bacterium]|nr:P-II family nitrogen regulator [Pseudomonadota bacterium]
MNLKLVVALVKEGGSEAVIDAARQAGATGATVITNCRGEGLEPGKTFLGLELAAQMDVVLFLVAAPRAREILETIAKAGHFDEEHGAGLAFQLAIEDAVGLKTQMPALLEEVEEEV